MAKILVVDDDERFRSATARALQLEGHQVEQARHGREAMKMVVSGFDLILSDIYMPEMDGIELILRLKEDGQSPKVVSMSGGGAFEIPMLKDAEMLGAVGVLSKPFTIGELYKAVDQALNIAEVT